MNYYNLQIGERDFHCKLATVDVVNLERRLGGINPLNVLMQMGEGGLPATGTLLIILQAAARENGKLLKIEEWYDLYDQYLASGKSIADLIVEIVEIFQVSGLIPEESDLKN